MDQWLLPGNAPRWGHLGGISLWGKRGGEMFTSEADDMAMRLCGRSSGGAMGDLSPTATLENPSRCGCDVKFEKE